MPVSVRAGKGETAPVDTDEGPEETPALRRWLSSSLCSKTGGTVTAGNSSSRNDGAAAVVVMSEEKAAELGIRPLARFVQLAFAGVQPHHHGHRPRSRHAKGAREVWAEP